MKHTKKGLIGLILCSNRDNAFCARCADRRTCGKRTERLLLGRRYNRIDMLRFRPFGDQRFWRRVIDGLVKSLFLLFRFFIRKSTGS